jgi:hypothetical protein
MVEPWLHWVLQERSVAVERRLEASRASPQKLLPGGLHLSHFDLDGPSDTTVREVQWHAMMMTPLSSSFNASFNNPSAP